MIAWRAGSKRPPVIRKRLWLQYPPEQVTQPLLYQMSRDLPVMFNIRTCSVSAEGGLIALEIEGTTKALEATLRWFRRRRVEVLPIEVGTVDG